MSQIAVVPSSCFKSEENNIISFNDFNSLEHKVKFIERETAEIFNEKQPRQIVTQVMIFQVKKCAYERLLSQDIDDNELVSNTDLLAHVRLGGDERLVGKVSVSFGGHVEQKDFFERGNPIDFEAAMIKSLKRELNEELYAKKYDGVWSRRLEEGLIYTGAICSNFSEVEKLHVGFIYFLTVPDFISLQTLERENIQMISIPLNDIKKFKSDNQNNIEQWSRIMMNAPIKSYLEGVKKSLFL